MLDLPSVFSLGTSKLIKIESTYLGDNASTADYDLAKLNTSM